MSHQHMKNNPGIHSVPMSTQGILPMPQNIPGKNFVGGLNNSNSLNQPYHFGGNQNQYGGMQQVPPQKPASNQHAMMNQNAQNGVIGSSASNIPMNSSPMRSAPEQSRSQNIQQSQPASQPTPQHNQQQSAAQKPQSQNQSQNQPQKPTQKQSQQQTTSQPTQQPSDLANTKEKTPMCLINELARYNKIQHQYTLIDEDGPAHKKTFTVKLKLGEEEYTASGPSIKKAQHAAAANALETTAFKHPPPKQNRQKREAIYAELEPGELTPTVELNALAMKRGEPASYRSVEPRYQQAYYPPPNFDFRGMYHQRYHYPRQQRMYCVSLKVGQREFFGEGPTRQAARHNAAVKALRILRNLPLPNPEKPKEANQDKNNSATVTASKDIRGDELKSEISLVHEIALKRNMSVTFEVIRESGPPHMKNFVTKCLAGEYVTEGEGNSKKLAKKNAAEKMMEELKKLPPLPQGPPRLKPRAALNKKKNRNLIKVEKADPAYGVGINPISRLIQIMQAQKKKEPLYSLIAERGLPRRREFVMQVQVDDQSCTGVGPNKKLAKRNAAEAMLQLLGYNQPTPQPTKPSIKSGGSPDVGAGDKKVTFVENKEADASGAASTAVNNKSGRQLMPGLLLVPEGKLNSSGYSQLKAEQGAGGDAYMGMRSNQNYGQTNMRPEQQLRDLARHNNIQVQYDEFSAKSNSNEYLSRVSLSTNPPQILIGTGLSPEAARKDATISAIKAILEFNTISAGAGNGSKMTTEL